MRLTDACVRSWYQCLLAGLLLRGTRSQQARKKTPIPRPHTSIRQTHRIAYLGNILKTHTASADGPSGGWSTWWS